VADRLGIGYDVLRAGHPGLIYVAIGGFGPDGPYATHPAYDLLIQGLVGIMPIQGGDGAPQLLKSLVADKCTALTAATATVAALLARERRGGEGQRIDVPMLDAFAAYVLPDLMTHYTFQPLDAPPPPPLDIYKTWATADGFVVGIVIDDAQFAGLCQTLGREDCLGMPQFGSFRSLRSAYCWAISGNDSHVFIGSFGLLQQMLHLAPQPMIKALIAHGEHRKRLPLQLARNHCTYLNQRFHRLHLE
jgi:crotonobetainyl-CoA:carnitine CoA-transferase CaiB-like acyl-CoA transferase